MMVLFGYFGLGAAIVYAATAPDMVEALTVFGAGGLWLLACGAVGVVVEKLFTRSYFTDEYHRFASGLHRPSAPGKASGLDGGGTP